MGKHVLKRFFWLLWLIGGLYFANKGASYYRQVSSLPEDVLNTISEIAPHHAADRVLVFAPHPDDEVLGCAGVIQQALQASAQVWVVYMSNGDGFRLAVERQYRQPKPPPEQYIQFGKLRQQEARSAMRTLALADWRVIFLGYPDHGLDTLWRHNWTPSDALTSYYTAVDANPYRDSLRPESLYCGQNVLRDVETVLRQTVPTHVYVTHPADDHPDHSATALFVQTALAHLQTQHIGFAQNVVLRYYMVHHGDWPQPQGLHPNKPLTPPPAYFHVGLSWKKLTLTPQQQLLKLKAIQAHASQMRMMGRFLQSFVRENELFVERTVMTKLEQGWTFVWGEPDAEDFLRELQSPADFTAGQLHFDNGHLVLHLDTRRRPRKGFSYTCTAHVLLPNGDLTAFTLQAKPGKHSVSVWTDEDGVNFRFPAAPKGSVITLHAESRFAGLPVDKTISQVIQTP